MADLKKYLTDPSLIFEGFFRQKTDFSIFQNKSQFRVRVLTTPEHHSGPNYQEDPDQNPGAASSSSKWWFKGRIMDVNMAHNKFLPDPCNNSIASDRAQVSSLISLHSTVFCDGHPGDIGVGDTVIATVDPGSGGKIYNLQNLNFLQVETKRMGGLKVGSECYKISNLDYSSGSPISANGVNPGDYTAAADPGICDWSNGAKAYRALWIHKSVPAAVGEEFFNGFLEDTGILVDSRKLGDTERGLVQLIPPAYEDWLRLAKAYEAKFPGKKLMSGGRGYRTYAGQVNVRVKRSGCADAGSMRSKCGEKPDGKQCNKGPGVTGVAATPGQSRHGWGCAVDLDRRHAEHRWTDAAGDPDDSVKSVNFKWLNKFGQNYNWILNVRGEPWHITWMKVSTAFEGQSDPSVRFSQSGVGDASIKEK